MTKILNDAQRRIEALRLTGSGAGCLDSFIRCANSNDTPLDLATLRMAREIVRDDPETRTYAELLGDQAPVSAVVEVGTGVHSELLELVEVTAMAAALKQAGYTPAEDRGQQTEDRHLDADRVKEAEARRVEKERCGLLRARIIEQLSATDFCTADLLSIITAIALAELRKAN